nr:MAG TPA: hypothetical protein [Caudoviricetes sp.]
MAPDSLRIKLIITLIVAVWRSARIAAVLVFHTKDTSFFLGF